MKEFRQLIKRGHERELVLSMLMAAYLVFGESPSGRTKMMLHSIAGVVSVFAVALLVLNTYGVVPGSLALMIAYKIALDGNSIFRPARPSPASTPVELTEEEEVHGRKGTLEEEMVSLMSPIVAGTDKAEFKPVQAGGVQGYEIGA